VLVITVLIAIFVVSLYPYLLYSMFGNYGFIIFLLAVIYAIISSVDP